MQVPCCQAVGGVTNSNCWCPVCECEHYCCSSCHDEHIAKHASFAYFKAWVIVTAQLVTLTKTLP